MRMSLQHLQQYSATMLQLYAVAAFWYPIANTVYHDRLAVA